MTDSFEHWINSMYESYFEDWLEGKATPKQMEKALNIREPLSKQELREMEKEQSFPLRKKTRISTQKRNDNTK